MLKILSHLRRHLALGLLLFALFPELSAAREDAAKLNPRHYGHAYWMNGFRKNPDDTSPDLLSFETGHYGFTLNINELNRAQFGKLNHSNYPASLTLGTSPIQQLPPAELSIQIDVAGKAYTAKRALTGPKDKAKRLEDHRMWEAGRYMQHFDVRNLVFEDAEGNSLSCDARLQIASWPDSLTLTAEITPELPLSDGPAFGIVGTGYTVVEKALTLAGTEGPDGEVFTLECWVNVPNDPSRLNNEWLLSKNGSQDQDGHIGFHIQGGRINAVMNTGGGHKNRHRLSESGHRRFKLDSWHHLAITYDGKTMKYYVDGHLQNSKPVNTTRTSGNLPIQLGSSNYNRGKFAYGTLDQIRMWNRALTQKELIFHSRNPSKMPAESGLQYEISFDGPEAQKPEKDHWQQASVHIQLKTAEKTWAKKSSVIDQWKFGKSRKLTLNAELAENAAHKTGIQVHVQTADDQNLPSAYWPELNCQVVEIKKLKRDWKTGYTDIRNYDEFTLDFQNDQSSLQEVPFMLYLHAEANITGLVPILCYEDGTPTGIPVQVSKNWHDGSYLCAYSLLPAQPGANRYRLRIAYGFYGTLPSASHAQLSLLGYGGNGRWDQLAIGCWGETICFDVNRSLVDVAVTDVRMLMARVGAEGRKWSWTNAGWGGDWIKVDGPDGKRHHPNEIKTAYLAHGPCLTDVHYTGHYGSQREVDFKTQVQTLRTDDYVRTFQKFQYTFEKTVAAKDAWLFKMGRTSGYAVPKFAYGNSEGLIQDISVPADLKKGNLLIDHQEIQGAAPWWVSFPGAGQTRDDGKGNGYRALVIRGFKATLGGKVYTQPTITAPVYQENSDGTKNVDLLLNAPKEIENFQPGDTIEMDLEWITLHRQADDYYGPNETYRQHLTKNPSSWKTTYREAIGNHLKVSVKGGTLLENYPVRVRAEANEVSALIQGGVGYVPIRFEGLSSATGYTLYQIIDDQPVPLDQAVHGKDFWQTDYDPVTKSYHRVYNLPLDGLPSSQWLLKRDS